MNSQEKPFLRRHEAAEYLTSRYGFGALGTLEKAATCGGGPLYRKAGRVVLYTAEDLDAWALSKMSAPLRSTSDAGADRAA